MIAWRSEREAASQASQLLAIFESIADAVIVYDREGNVLRANAADAEILGSRQPPEAPVRTLGERNQMFTVVDEDGHPMSSDQWPSARVLKGEVLRGSSAADILLRTVDGQDIVLNASGAPVRDAEGNIVGGVLIGRDVTQRRRLEQQTHEALTALMTMAEALTSNDMTSSDNTLASARPAAMRLAELTRAVMGCERVGVHVYDLETRLAYTLAVAGITKEQEQLAAHTYTARMNNPPETVKRLQAGDVVAIDLTCPPYDRWPNPLGSRSILLAPISVGGPILGDISVDYGAVEHRPTAGEIAMARTIAKLAAQIIERGRLAHEREEARANALALVETTRRMDEFLSIAAHELKTPVTNSMLTVTLASVMLKRFIADSVVSQTAQDALMADTLRPLLKLLERTSNHMDQLSRLVVDLLDISRIRDGKLEMRVGACNLADLVRDVVEEQRQLAPGRAIRLRLPAASRRAPSVRADTDRIRQVVANYLSNALKYSRDGRQVNVEVRTDDEWARVSVRDHGPGVPRAEQRRVWECCYRVEGTQVLSGTSVGLGLGLYISRSIIEQHYGRVGLRSTEGQGAAFWFALPLVTSSTS
ncbi:MAG TPA: ATP-binding protein [Ktedonobacterales bacterium]|nr:ATP-binding protein [Ktedonobacterales bacterium]